MAKKETIKERNARKRKEREARRKEINSAKRSKKAMIEAKRRKTEAGNPDVLSISKASVDNKKETNQEKNARKRKERETRRKEINSARLSLQAMKEAKRRKTEAGNPDVLSVRTSPANAAVVKTSNIPKKVKNTAKGDSNVGIGFVEGTANAMPKTRPELPSRSKETVDEYAEAFASPDASKMYDLSEKNRRKDMNMLERAFKDIKAGGKRASADRKKRGLSDYDMNKDVFGSRLGGGIQNTIDNKNSSVRKRPALRGHRAEQRGG